MHVPVISIFLSALSDTYELTYHLTTNLTYMDIPDAQIRTSICFGHAMLNLGREVRKLKAQLRMHQTFCKRDAQNSRLSIVHDRSLLKSQTLSPSRQGVLALIVVQKKPSASPALL